MPAKTSKNAGSFKFGEIQFVNVTLDKSDRESFVAWYENAMADVDTHVADLLSRSYKMSLSDDQSNDCVICTLTCKDDRSPNHNYSMSSRAGNWLEAVMLSVYKTNILYPEKKGGWPKEVQQRGWG